MEDCNEGRNGGLFSCMELKIRHERDMMSETQQRELLDDAPCASIAVRVLEKTILWVLVALVDAVELYETQHCRAEPEKAAEAKGHHAVLEREEHGERVDELQRGRQEEAECAEPVEPRDPRLERREAPGEPLVHDLDVCQIGAQQHEERADEERQPIAQDERKVGPADVDHAVVSASVIAQQQECAREQKQH